MHLLLQTTLILFSLLATAQAISLANFEETIHVPKDCNDAWTAPISGCASSDFLAKGGSCSSTCIASLQDVAKTVSIACQGVAVDPTTLMGLFFEGKGINAVCPNIVVTSVVGGGGGNGAATTTMGTIIGSSTAAAPSLPSGSTEILYDTSAFLATKSSMLQSSSATSSSSPPSKPTIPASTQAASTSTSSSITSSVSATTSTTTTVVTKTSSTTLAMNTSPTSAVVSSVVSTSTTSSVTSVPSVTTTSSRSVLPLPPIESSAGGNKNAQTHEANPQITGGGGSPFEVSNDGGANTVPWHIPYVIGVTLGLWLYS
ncbi:MAG: hypothetical protein M1812_005463 [Candelaria pacifica]|nr:MAG: hypothetical protein M1812_005463 [Candelaria pacifica]